MKIGWAGKIDNIGYVFITDQEVPQLDWSEERKIQKIKVSMGEGQKEYKVRSVELSYRDSMDYLSFLIEEDLDGTDLTSYEGKVVEPFA